MLIREPLLGTRAEVHVSADSDSRAATLEGSIFDEVERLESVFTLYDQSSALNEYKRSGATTVAELVTVAELATAWHERTNGAFHPAMQPLVDAWNDAEAAKTPPADDHLRSVVAELEAVAVAHLDFNAVAKGWIADRAVEVAFAHAEPAQGAWLNIGGDLVHRGEGSVRVGIEDPSRPYDNVPPMTEVEVANEAVATSGGARRFWTIGDTRYAKVLDPRTGWPVEGVRSATVIAEDLATADVLATTAVVLPTEETLALVRSVGGACFLVLADGKVVQSSDRFRPV